MLEIGLRLLVVNSLVTCRKFAFLPVHSRFLLFISVTSACQGIFPLKKGKVTKKFSAKATSPKERLLNANSRCTSAQQSTADRTLAVKDFLYLNLQITNNC